MPPERTKEETTVRVLRFCLHCCHEWYQMVTREQLRKIGNNEPVGNCPDPKCGLPT